MKVISSWSLRKLFDKTICLLHDNRGNILFSCRGLIDVKLLVSANESKQVKSK